VDANQFGCFAEYKFAIQAMEWGFNVSMPMLDASPYDLILEKDGTLFKFQIKSITNTRTNKITRSDVQCVLRSDGKEYPKHLVDYFAIYVERDQGFYVIKNKGQKAIRLSTSGIYKENFNTFTHIL
jgi:hypothetical protein